MFEKLMRLVRPRKSAYQDLQTELERNGFIIWPCDSNHALLELRLSVLVVDNFSEPPFRESKPAHDILRIAEKVASKYGLTSKGLGPVCIENAVWVVSLGFR